MTIRIRPNYYLAHSDDAIDMPVRMLVDKSLSPNAKTVWLGLYYLEHWSGEPWAGKGDAALSELLGLSNGAIWAALRELNAAGAVDGVAWLPSPQEADRRRGLGRTEVRQATCPNCGAGPGERCVSPHGRPREMNHRERVHAAWDRVGI